MLLLKETTSNQEYWNGVAYRRGYDEGKGWAESCGDIPYNYRSDAKDAYDQGVEDYAQFYEEEDMISDKELKETPDTETIDVTPDWDNLLLYFRAMAQEAKNIGIIDGVGIRSGDGGVVCRNENGVVFWLNHGKWDRTAYAWENLKSDMYIYGEYIWTVNKKGE